MSNGHTVPDYKPILELARYELDYRRKKQWDIFIWVVTILVSVIGGIIVVAKDSAKLDGVPRDAMAFALAVLTMYAGFWINENIKAEKRADKALRALLRDIKLQNDPTEQIHPIKKPSAFAFGYVWIVVLVGLAAVIAVLFVNANPLGLCIQNKS